MYQVRCRRFWQTSILTNLWFQLQGVLSLHEFWAREKVVQAEFVLVRYLACTNFPQQYVLCKVIQIARNSFSSKYYVHIGYVHIGYVHGTILVLKEIHARQVVVLKEIRNLQIVLYLSVQVKYFRASQKNRDPFETSCQWNSCKPRTPCIAKNISQKTWQLISSLVLK